LESGRHPASDAPLAAARSPARGTVPNESRYVNDGMELEMEQQQVEEGDRAVVARRLFKALCELYPDRFVTLVESRDCVAESPAVACCVHRDAMKVLTAAGDVRVLHPAFAGFHPQVQHSLHAPLHTKDH
jgi:hypothetical protein